MSLLTWQPFANYNRLDGWYPISSPLISSNSGADRSRDKWTAPIGGGFGRVFRIGSLPPINA